MNYTKTKFREARILEILSLKLKYKVTKLTEYQYRIEDKIDLYPTSRKYHVLKTNERGQYPSAITTVMDILNYLETH